MIGVAGVANDGAITTMSNSGTIMGGGATGFSAHVVRGAGCPTPAQSRPLTNSGAMRGASSFYVTTTGVLGGAGGAGLANSGTIATLTNKGTISGETA